MLLCDVGNTRMHFCIGNDILHLSHKDGMQQYKDEKVYFISVNQEIASQIKKVALNWIEIKSGNNLKTSYEGLGIDRIAACLGMENGVVIDAGSAITVDIVENGKHQGGWIWPGIKAQLKSYTNISKRLSVSLNNSVDIKKLPKNTTDAISFAILAPIVYLVNTFAQDRKVVLTGGDAKILSSLFPDAEVDENIIFKGMKKMIKESGC